MECPCKNCVPPKRTPSCHSMCDAYIKWLEEHNKEKELSKAYNEFINDIIGSYYSKRKKK